jgi:uncharacterized protein
MDRLTKSFPVFDCDAHINDPLEIWAKYVPESEKELVRETYWSDADGGILNGTVRVFAGDTRGMPSRRRTFNPICIAGPQMDKKVQRRLRQYGSMTFEQVDYLEHKGAYDPRARLKEMDLMGIDQVLVIPTMMIRNLPFARNIEGVNAFVRAYNNWLRDWVSEVPDRTYGAAMLPIHDPAHSAAEVRRAAELGFPVVLIRPIDAQGKYPNDIGTAMTTNLGSDFGAPTYDAVFKAIEEAGVCLGMHAFPSHVPDAPDATTMYSPGLLCEYAEFDSQSLSFIYEAQTWLAQVLLSGFLDRYPRLKMLIFESNSMWLPSLLHQCDRLFKLYKNERRLPATRLPSEAFYEQCAISFESDETATFRQWRSFENIGLWASDCYHHDGADVWSAIRDMDEVGVPQDVQAKMLGANARRLYGIEPRMYVSEEPGPIERPDWFPKEAELAEWSKLVAHPRQNGDELAKRGWDAPAGMGAGYQS